MRNISSIAITGVFFLATACNLTPTATPTPGAKPAETPTGSEKTVVEGSPYPTETSTPAIPEGFFPIAIGDTHNPGMAILLGATENGVWMDSAAAAARLSGDETYNLFSPAGLAGTAVGTAPTRDMICGQYTIQWDPPPSATSLIGLGGGWNALPRAPEDPAISSFPTYTTAAGDWLATQGIPVPDPLRLTGLKRVDLDGDGNMEAIISASRFSEDTLHDVAAGDFSMVLLYRESAPETILLAGNFYPAGQSLAFPNAYSLLSILDLNGDGRMEVIVHVSRWEGGGTLVYAFNGSGADPVFNSVCSM